MWAGPLATRYESLRGRERLDLAEEFLRSFGSELRELGFRRVPKRATFHCRTFEGWRGVHAPITRYLDGAIVIALTAIIRFDSVERLLLKFSDSPLYTDGPNRGTLGLYMTAEAGEDRGASVTIEGEGDIQKAVAWARLRCETQAYPFFQAFPTLRIAYAALTAEAEPCQFDFPFSQERAKRVLAAAVALGHAADLPDLIAAQQRRLAKDPQAIAADFDEFAHKLMRDCAES